LATMIACQKDVIIAGHSVINEKKIEIQFCKMQMFDKKKVVEVPL